MVHKLKQQGIVDPQVLAAMARVERHRFVDTALVNQAYEDTSLPIGLGRASLQAGGGVPYARIVVPGQKRPSREGA